MEEILKQLVVSNAAQQQSNAAQQRANAAQQQANSLLQQQIGVIQEKTQQANSLIHQQICAVQEQTKQANTAQQQTNSLIQQQIGAVQNQTQLMFEKLTSAAEADRKVLAEVVQTLAQESAVKTEPVRDHSSAIHVGRFLSKMTADDDPEAFLVKFERTAEREGWPSGQD